MHDITNSTLELAIGPSDIAWYVKLVKANSFPQARQQVEHKATLP